jgi:hypothetical protein
VPFFPQTAHHCGPAALAAVLSYSGVDTDPSALAGMVYIPGRKGTLAVEMAAATRRLGRMPYLPDGTLAALAAEVRDGRPVVVLLNLGAAMLPRWHYAVVVGYDGSRERMILRSGGTRRKTMAVSRFMRAWRGGGGWALLSLVPGEVPVTARPAAFARQAAVLEKAGMAAEAEAAYRGGMARWPGEAVFHLGLGNVLSATERFGAAEREFRLFLRRKPGSAAGLNNLAHVVSLQGRHEEAIAIIGDAALAAAGTGLEDAVASTREEIVGRHRAGEAARP